MADDTGYIGGSNGTRTVVGEYLTREDPVTKGYKPSQSLSNLVFPNNPWIHLTWDIDRMLMSPCVTLPLSYYKSGISGAEFKVTASSKQVAEFYLEQLESLFKFLDLLQRSYDWGWGGFEVVYREEQNKIILDDVLDFNPRDVCALTRRAKYVGFRVRSGILGGAASFGYSTPAGFNHGDNDAWGLGSGSADLPGPRKLKRDADPDVPAKGLWLTHNPHYGRWYGRSQLYSAWWPWKQLAGEDGVESIIAMALYRFGVAGPVVWYPPHDPKMPGADGRTSAPMSARDKALEMAEGLKAGGSVAMPSFYDDEGNLMWKMEFPQRTFDPSPLLASVDALEKAVSKGIGVPPELLEASETGSGYSGRQIPMEAFMMGQQRLAESLVRQFDRQVGSPLIRWNFGSNAWAHVEVLPLLQTKAKQARGGQPGPGGPPMPPPGAGAPPAGPPGPPPAGPGGGAPPPQSDPLAQLLAGAGGGGEGGPAKMSTLFRMGCGPHSFASTQFNLPPALARRCLAFGESIDPEDLAEDGLEDTPHVTLVFGLESDSPDEVIAALAEEKSFPCRLGAVTLFETPEFDVVKVDVESGDLRRLHDRLCGAVQNTRTHPSCHPHVTIAYVKPGRGAKYAGWRGLDGAEFVARDVIFSSRGGRRKRIRLADPPAKLLSSVHAPKGGVSVAGKFFPGGEFIPSEVMAQATPDERATIGAGEGDSHPRRFDGDPYEAETYGKEQFAEWFNGLSKDERWAVNAYSGGGYDLINEFLRNRKGDSVEGGPGSTIKVVQNLDRALSRGKTAEPMVVYRGAKWEMVDKLVKAAQSGGTVVDRAYLSTTLAKYRVSKFVAKQGDADRALLEIHVPKGTTGAYIDFDITGEAEFLMPRDTPIRLTGATQDEDGLWHLKAEVVQGPTRLATDAAPATVATSGGGQQPVAAAAAAGAGEWQWAPGPRSRRRWVNVRTGAVRYSDTNPGTRGGTPDQGVSHHQPGAPSWEASGSQVGTLYAGADRQVTDEDLAGLAGHWFGVSADQQTAGNAGDAVTPLRVADDARVLVADASAEDAPQGLADAVRQHVGGSLTEGWEAACRRFAEAQQYDIVMFSVDDVEVRNAKVLSVQTDPVVLSLIRMAAEDWQNQPGPRSRRRWVNVNTGRVRYSDQNPGGKERGKQATPDDVVNRMNDIKAGKGTPGVVGEIAGMLLQLKVDDIKAVKAKMGLKRTGGRRKSDLAQKIEEKFLAHLPVGPPAPGRQQQAAPAASPQQAPAAPQAAPAPAQAQPQVPPQPAATPALAPAPAPTTPADAHLTENEDAPAKEAPAVPTAAEGETVFPDMKDKKPAPPKRTPEQAKEEYKRLWTKAPAFLEWFGDWTKDPQSASKVVKADGSPQETHHMEYADGGKGVPVRVYHGTPFDEFKEFRKDKLGNPEDLLFGPGFYFTDNQIIADDYRKRGSGVVDLPPAGIKGTPRDASKTIKSLLASRGEELKKEMEAGGRELEERAARMNHLWRTVTADPRTPKEQHPEWGRHAQAMKDHRAASVALTATKEKLARVQNYVQHKRFLDPNHVARDVNSSFNELQDLLGDRLDEVVDAPKGHIFEAYLNIRNPFDGHDDTVNPSKMPEDLRNEMATRFGKPAFVGKQPKDFGKDEWEKVHEAYREAFQNATMSSRSFDYFVKKMSEDRGEGMTSLASHLMHHGDEQDENRKRFEESLNKLGMRTTRSFSLPDEAVRYQELTKLVGSKANANRVLAALGYDGITHVGQHGARAGEKVPGVDSHRVYIAFEPHQIKSADNQGTFDPAQGRIDLAAMRRLSPTSFTFTFNED